MHSALSEVELAIFQWCQDCSFVSWQGVSTYIHVHVLMAQFSRLKSRDVNGAHSSATFGVVEHTQCQLLLN